MLTRLSKTLLLLVLLLATPKAAFPADRLLPSGTKVDFIVVEKSKRLMTVYCNGKAIRSYRIALGKNPIGPKEREGDKQSFNPGITATTFQPPSGLPQMIRRIPCVSLHHQITIPVP